jgi:hypothetical protein
MIVKKYQHLIIKVKKSYIPVIIKKRIMELSQDVGHRPIIFIRFNPDSYYNGTDKIESCWRLDTGGLCTIRNERVWNERLNVLANQIKYWTDINNSTHKTVEVIELFYDI